MIGHIMRQDRNKDFNKCVDMGPRGETEKGHGDEREGRSRLEILERGADSSSGPGEVEKLCEGLMCHDARSG